MMSIFFCYFVPTTMNFSAVKIVSDYPFTNSNACHDIEHNTGTCSAVYGNMCTAKLNPTCGVDGVESAESVGNSQSRRCTGSACFGDYVFTR
jgi:hypothetical protein